MGRLTKHRRCFWCGLRVEEVPPGWREIGWFWCCPECQPTN